MRNARTTKYHVYVTYFHCLQARLEFDSLSTSCCFLVVATRFATRMNTDMTTAGSRHFYTNCNVQQWQQQQQRRQLQLCGTLTGKTFYQTFAACGLLSIRYANSAEGCGAAGGPRLRGPGLLYVFPAVVMIISIAVAIAAAVSSVSSVPMGVAAVGAEMTSTSQLQLQLQMYVIFFRDKMYLPELLRKASSKCINPLNLSMNQPI